MAMYDLQPDLYGTPINTQSDQNSDMEMEICLMHGMDDVFYVMHDRPFYKELSWVEFDVANGKLDFIMDDGELRDFGIPVKAEFINDLQYKDTLSIALMENGQYKDGNQYPLIVHQIH